MQQSNSSPPDFSGSISAINCPSCGGELQIPPRVEYVQCPYCRSSVKVREAEQILPAPASTPVLNQSIAESLSPDEQPWYRSSWGMWIAFFGFLPAWVVLVLTDPKQPRFLKITAWVLIGLMVYSILVSSFS